MRVRARASSAIFVAAYMDAGRFTSSASLKGTFVLSPYTEEEEAYTTLMDGLVCRTASCDRARAAAAPRQGVPAARRRAISCSSHA